MHLLPSIRSRATLAAMRLAAVYAAGVTLLFLALVVRDAGIREVLREVEFLAIPAGICFGAAFLLLAIGRRLGFTALWLCSLGFWAWLTLRYQHLGWWPAANFLVWSVLSAPLYLIVHVGFRPPTSTRRWTKLTTFAEFILWTSLAVAAVLMDPPIDVVMLDEPWWFGTLERILTVAWYLTPPVVTMLALRHVHRSPDARRVAQ